MLDELQSSKSEFRLVIDNPFATNFSTVESVEKVDEPDTQSFVVKVWLEETVEEAGQARWRGHVTHVTSGERKYLESLSGITNFIKPYLERWGVVFGIKHKIRRLVKKKKLPQKKKKLAARKHNLF